MDWVLGSFALISVVIALGALRKIATMQEQVAKKVEGTFR
jgi:hypothetical protein